MRRVIYALAAVAVTFSSMVLAQAPAQSEKKPVAKSEKKSTALSANGKVEKFDEATKTLTLSTKDGEKAFTVGADAKIMSGAKSASTAELAGKQVKVTYSRVNGKDVASKVTIATSKPTATSGKLAEKK
jgi:hypothetical protein